MFFVLCNNNYFYFLFNILFFLFFVKNFVYQFFNYSKITLSNNCKNQTVLFDFFYYWNGSHYRYQLINELRQFIILKLSNSRFLITSWLHWNLFFILSGKSDTKTPSRIQGNPFTNDSWKGRGFWHFPDDLTFQEIAVVARHIRMLRSAAERENRAFTALDTVPLYLRLMHDIANRIEAQEWHVRENLINQQYIDAWELLRNEKEATPEQIKYWLNIMAQKIELSLFQQLAYHGALEAEMKNLTPPEQPKLFETGQKLIDALAENQKEYVRLTKSKKYLADLQKMVDETDPANLQLDLGYVFVYVFGDYTEEEAIEVSLQAREAGERAIMALKQMPQHEITALRQDLPVWSTLISADDITDKVLEFASDSFPYDFDYLTDLHWRWKQWRPEAFADIEVQSFDPIMTEIDSSFPEGHTMSEYMLVAFAVSTIFMRGLLDEPLLQQTSIQLPQQLKEMPVVYGSRGMHIATKDELHNLYQKKNVAALDYIAQAKEAANGIDVPPSSFSWGGLITGICFFGILYYYRHEVWTFIDESATSILTNKSKFRIRYERTQELLRKKEAALKYIEEQNRAKWERFRDEVALSYAPNERDLRTVSERNRDLFIEALWNDWREFTELVDPYFLWFLENAATIKILFWYYSAIYLYVFLLKKLFPFENRFRQWFFWRAFKDRKFHGYGKREEEELPNRFKDNWPKLYNIKEKIVLFVRTLYYNAIYCSRFDYFLLLLFVTSIAWLLCWFITDWRFHFTNPEIASAQYYIIDDTCKWSHTQQFPLFDTLASNIYKTDLLLAKYLEPQTILYPDGTDSLFLTKGSLLPDLPLESGCWPRFWAAQITYGRGDWYYREDIPLFTNDAWNDYWVWTHFRGIFRYSPYSVEAFNAIVRPTLIQGELKAFLWIPLAILNIVLMWWNFINPRLGEWEDLDNPDNLISGPERVYINENQKLLIEADEKKIYAEKMDAHVAIWKTSNLREEDNATLTFFLEKSALAWEEARREASEKHWLPYTKIVDRDGMPRPFNSRDRGHDREYVWERIKEDRQAYRQLCHEAMYNHWTPYEIMLTKIYQEKNIFVYWVSWLYFRYQYHKTLVLPVYRSKWEELVQDDPHPDDEIYGSGG